MRVNYPGSLYEHATQEDASPWISAVKAINDIRQAQANITGTNQENRYRPDIRKAQITAAELGNEKSQAEQPYWGDMAKANLAKANLEPSVMQANINETNQTTRYDKFKADNPMLFQSGIAGDIAAAKYYQDTGDSEGAKKIKERINAETAYKQMGGASGRGAGVNQRDQMFLQSQFQKEYPEWSPEKAYEAAGHAILGENQFKDGTELPPLSGNVQQTLAGMLKRNTSAALMTRNIQAKQAEKEINELNKYAQKGMAPYGDTYANMSPQQIADTFKNDAASQKKLGRFIGSQALNYEIAQGRIRLANGEPGAAATEELMRLSGQQIDSKWPQLSYTARKEASDYLDEALKKGLEARQSVGISATNANVYGNNSPKKPKESNSAVGVEDKGDHDYEYDVKTRIYRKAN